MRVRSADQPDLLQVLLGADGAFDDRDVDVVRILPRIDQRAVDQVRLGAIMMMPSSTSSSDMWQPEQPSSHIVANLGFFMCSPHVSRQAP